MLAVVLSCIDIIVYFYNAPRGIYLHTTIIEKLLGNHFTRFSGMWTLGVLIILFVPIATFLGRSQRNIRDIIPFSLNAGIHVIIAFVLACIFCGKANDYPMFTSVSDYQRFEAPNGDYAICFEQVDYWAIEEPALETFVEGPDKTLRVCKEIPSYVAANVEKVIWKDTEIQVILKKTEQDGRQIVEFSYEQLESYFEE